MSTPSAPEPSGLPLRALAMVLLAAAVVFAGLGFISLSGSDADADAAQPTSPAATSAPAAAGGAATTARAAASGAGQDAPATSTAPTSAPGSSTTTTAAGPTTAAGAASSGSSDVPVRVYNNSTVEGLAGRTASTLESDGWTIDHIGNYDEGEVPSSAVYYGTGPGEKAAAQKVGAELGLPVEPRFAGIADASPGVIVILTAQG